MKLPELKEGEIYIGGTIDTTGTLTHIILLPGDNDDAQWQAQMDWAGSLGGDLPNRVEQSMLWASHRDQFKNDLYWSNETHHSDAGYTWCQDFHYGAQYGYCKSNKLRARTVRRVAVNPLEDKGN